VAQVRVLGLALVHHIQIRLHLRKLLVLLVLDLLVVAHRHEEIILQCRDLKVLQQNCLVVLLQLGHKLSNLLLVYARRTVVKQRALYQLATRYQKLVKRTLTLTSLVGVSCHLVARLGS
jgi:predicted membrane protein